MDRQSGPDCFVSIRFRGALWLFVCVLRKTYALVVDDLNNGGELAILGSSIDEHNTADLNESPSGSFDLNLSSAPIPRDSCFAHSRIRTSASPILKLSKGRLVIWC